jgi:hypothetical protein
MIFHNFIVNLLTVDMHNIKGILLINYYIFIVTV